MINNELILNKIIQIEANVDQVWDALINPDKIKEYFYGTKAISEWKEGSDIRFEGEWEGKSYVEKGIITEIIPLQKFEYKYLSGFSNLKDSPENYSLLTYQLAPTPEKNQTTLTVTQVGFENEKAKEGSENSWQEILENIKKVVEK